MAIYAINTEGVEALKKLANGILIEANAIVEQNNTLKQVISGQKDGLGIYGDEIIDIVQKNELVLRQNRDDIIQLAERVRWLADEFQTILSASGESGSGQQGGTSASGSGGADTATGVSGASKMYSSIVEALNDQEVEYRGIKEYGQDRTEEEIIDRISGGDTTEGSCSSLAFAYAGNKAGYDVLDFRDGSSRDYFSQRDSIEKIAKLPGVRSAIFYGKDDIESANNLLNDMALGKEYYMATGRHAAIVRRYGDHYEYLELQHPLSYGNGWKYLDDSGLKVRFGCEKRILFKNSNFLIEVDSLAGSQEFLNILGYINTAESEQRKGDTGYVR